MDTGTRSNTILYAIGGLVALLVIVALVFALQPPPEFDADSPEGALQGFYEAVLDGDEALASTYMTAELQQACDNHFWYIDRDESARIVITDSDVDGDEAELDVTITITYGEGPFGGGGYDEHETVTLEHQDDGWLISEPTWPMDPWNCGEREG